MGSRQNSPKTEDSDSYQDSIKMSAKSSWDLLSRNTSFAARQMVNTTPAFNGDQMHAISEEPSRPEFQHPIPTSNTRVVFRASESQVKMEKAVFNKLDSIREQFRVIQQTNRVSKNSQLSRNKFLDESSAVKNNTGPFNDNSGQSKTSSICAILGANRHLNRRGQPKSFDKINENRKQRT